MLSGAKLSLLLLKFAVELMMPKPPGGETVLAATGTEGTNAAQLALGFWQAGLKFSVMLPGSASWLRLKTLKASARNSNVRRSLIFVCLVSATSICHVLGARTRPRPALPKRSRLPLASVGGDWNAAGLIQLLAFWFVGTTDAPDTKSGRWLLLSLPSGRKDPSG